VDRELKDKPMDNKKIRDYWINDSRDFYKINGGMECRLHNTGTVEEMLFQYAEKYRKAAYYITDYVMDKHDISKLDTYFFPIAFLFRHSIELCLKASLFKYVIDAEERIQIMDKTKHNLRDIFDELEARSGGRFKIEDTYISWIKEFLSNINEVDKESDSFRYPFGIIVKDCFGEKNYGIRTLFDKQTHIDLVKFGNKMLFTYDIVKAIYHDEIPELDEYKDLDPVLFEEGGNYYQQCVVGYKFSIEEFYPYVKAYMETPEILFELIVESNNEPDRKNELFLPMCYLFRNATELLIKQIMFEESSYGYQEALKKMNKKKHKVVGLWNLIVDDIKEHANADESDNTCEIAFKYINKLNEIDVRADIFRYPINSVLEVYFQKTQKLDIENVFEFFMELLKFLDSATCMMSVQNEWKAEMEY
jgi:hypothetical protein